MMDKTDNHKENNRKIARSEEDKERQYYEIIDVGRELFIKKGSYGFTTRALAKKLKMSQPNLYTYIASKRELWIAIRNEDWKVFKKQLERIVNKHEGTHIELFEKLIIYFLEFVKKDYKRFQMMFLIPPPPSNKMGPIESTYKPIAPLDVLKEVVKNAIKAKEIPKVDGDFFTYYLVGLAYGMAYIERELRFQDPITEPIEDNSGPERIAAFRDFILKQIRKNFKPSD